MKMNEIIPVTNLVAIKRPSLINTIAKIIPAIFNKNKITSKKIKDDELSVDISGDNTTYIKCLFHDFRGPLNNISLGVDVLLDSIDKHSDNFSVLKSIKESCSFLGESLDGFLTMGKMDDTENKFIEIKLEPFNIIGLIKKIQYILLFNAMKKKINIKYNIKPIEEWVIGDYKNIQHVVLNLLTNAIKFSSEGGNLIVQLERIKNNDNKKQHIVISIIDENGFISKVIKEHIFEKYNTSDSVSGTGLGLYICKKIVEMHGGKIHHLNNNNLKLFTGNLSSSKNLKKGNIFQVELFLDICPASKKELDDIISIRSNYVNVDKCEKKETDLRFDMGECVEISGNVVEDENVHLNNSTELMKKSKTDSVHILFSDSKSKELVNIMVIDDSEISRKMLVRLLELNCKNVRIIDAIDGLDALIKMVNFKEKEKNKISMLLLDNVMPNLTGGLLSKILRGIGYDGLIIGITGNGLEDDKEKYLESGADYVFVKPFNKQKLVMLLELIKISGYDRKKSLNVIEEGGRLLWR
jgi:signal transduction histidine kinase